MESRVIVEQDVGQINKIMTRLFVKPYIYSEETILSLKSQSKSLVTLANGNVVGFLLAGNVESLQTNKEVLTIVAFGVDLNYQRQAIGYNLLDTFIKRNKFSDIYLHVKVNNKAVDLYQKHSFKVISLIKGYYVDTDPATDGYYMVRKSTMVRPKW